MKAVGKTETKTNVKRNPVMKFIYHFASPKHFYRISGKLIPWLGWFTAILIIAGSVDGLFFAPVDYQQGDSYRIIFIHVPAAK